MMAHTIINNSMTPNEMLKLYFFCFLVGASEGTIVVVPQGGDTVGYTVSPTGIFGANVGTIVIGPTEDDTVGDTVGRSNVVGAADGTIVVGPTEGDLLGDNVSVGADDGDWDGVSVGAAVIQSAPGELHEQRLSFHNPAFSLLPRYMYTHTPSVSPLGSPLSQLK